MNLPKQVIEAGRKADEGIAALRGESQDEGTPDNEGNTPEPGQQSQPGSTADGASEPNATPNTPAEGGEGIDWKLEHEKLTQKFNVLKGKFDAENPTLKRENADLREELRGLQGRLERLESNGAPPTSDDGTDPAQGEEPSEEILEMYGEDLIKFMDQRMASIAAGAVSRAVKPVKDQFDGMQAQSAEERQNAFLAAVTEAHPDWHQINELDQWIAFCGETMPDVGLMRQVILNQAVRDHNPGPVIAQLDAFKKRFGQGEQRRLSNRETPPDGGAPGPSPLGDTGEAPQIKESEISKFYQQLAIGKYRGREEEAVRFEDQIRQAHEAGTVIMDVTGSRGPVFSNA